MPLNGRVHDILHIMFLSFVSGFLSVLLNVLHVLRPVLRPIARGIKCGVVRYRRWRVESARRRLKAAGEKAVSELCYDMSNQDDQDEMAAWWEMYSPGTNARLARGGDPIYRARYDRLMRKYPKLFSKQSVTQPSQKPLELERRTLQERIWSNEIEHQFTVGAVTDALGRLQNHGRVQIEGLKLPNPPVLDAARTLRQVVEDNFPSSTVPAHTIVHGKYCYQELTNIFKKAFRRLLEVEIARYLSAYQGRLHTFAPEVQRSSHDLAENAAVVQVEKGWKDACARFPRNSTVIIPWRRQNEDGPKWLWKCLTDRELNHSRMDEVDTFAYFDGIGGQLTTEERKTVLRDCLRTFYTVQELLAMQPSAEQIAIWRESIAGRRIQEQFPELVRS